MKLWDKIKIDFEFLGLTSEQLSEKYEVDVSRIDLRSSLEEWINKSKGSNWPELFHEHQNVDTRVEMLEYLLHESTYQKVYELEHEIYDCLLEVARQIDPNIPISAVGVLSSVIAEFKQLKELQIKALEVYQKSPESSTEELHGSSNGLYLNEVLEEIESARELEFFRSIIERIEQKRSFNADRSKISGDIPTQIH